MSGQGSVSGLNFSIASLVVMELIRGFPNRPMYSLGLGPRGRLSKSWALSLFMRVFECLVLVF